MYAFDLLYLNGESLVQQPFRRRRELLRESFTEVDGEFTFATSMISSNTEEISEFLEESIKGENQLFKVDFTSSLYIVGGKNDLNLTPARKRALHNTSVFLPVCNFVCLSHQLDEGMMSLVIILTYSV